MTRGGSLAQGVYLDLLTISSHLINHKHVNKTLTFFFLIIKHNLNDEYYSNLNIGKFYSALQ